MKTCPNCDGTRKRNYEGNAPGGHPCRMCIGRGLILEPGDAEWLSRGWVGGTHDWWCSPPGKEKAEPFSIYELATLIFGADAVPGDLSKAALAERGLMDAWRGIKIHRRERGLSRAKSTE